MKYVVHFIRQVESLRDNFISTGETPVVGGQVRVVVENKFRGVGGRVYLEVG
jgi:hypothetical protein